MPPRLERKRFSGGSLKAQNTLVRMRENVKAACSQPATWTAAHAAIEKVAERDQPAQAAAVRAWCAARFRYVNDPIGIELLKVPAWHFDEIRRAGKSWGDCDDAASLTAAMCSAIGIASELWAVGFGKLGPRYQHVFAVAFPRGGGPVELDITRPPGVPMPPKFERRLRLRV